MEGHLEEDVKNQRRDDLMAVQQQVMFDYNEKQIGRTIDVILDQPVAGQPGAWIGRGKGDAPDVDSVVFTGSELADTLTVEGVFADFDQTVFGADSEGDFSTKISKEIVQLRDQTPGRDSRAFIVNSSPDKDVLDVLGLGGDDTLMVSAGSDNIDVSDLIASRCSAVTITTRWSVRSTTSR